MKTYESKIIMALVGLLLYTLTLTLLGPVMSALTTSKTVGNTGTVKAIGVGVFWDQSCTQPVSAFNWGTLEPNSTQTISCYIKNEGNSPLTLAMSTSNWNPAAAAQYITLTWDKEGVSLNAGQVVKATFTLKVAANIQGITNFSFDITIAGTG